MKEINKKTLCYTCYGCNRLENEWFMGINKCENYINARKEKETNDRQTSLQNFN